MYSANTMTAREKLFTMRMSADEIGRLERLAEHYGLTVAGTIRLIAKEKYDAVMAARASEEREDFRSEHALVLETIDVFADGSRSRIPGRIPAAKLHHDDFREELRLRTRNHEGVDMTGGVNRVVNDLTRWGYLRRLRGQSTGVISYEVTGKRSGA